MGVWERRGNYGVWKMLNLSFPMYIFCSHARLMCVRNCNTWAHLVRIWRHSQNSACQFLFHHQCDMDDRSAVTRVVTYPAHGNYYSHGASFQSTLWLICFWWKGAGEGCFGILGLKWHQGLSCGLIYSVSECGSAMWSSRFQPAHCCVYNPTTSYISELCDRNGSSRSITQQNRLTEKGIIRTSLAEDLLGPQSGWHLYLWLLFLA